MNLFQSKIIKTKTRIAKLKSYKKIFQEALYNAMHRAKNKKDLKKELVTLKRLFLEKEDIEAVEKPYESNYESQRQFLENNINENKTKQKSAQGLFSKDHQKLMKENMNLIKIVNELEREKKDIEGKSVDQYMSSNEKNTNTLKSNITKKPALPKVGVNNTFENKIRTLRESLLEVEKDIQVLKLSKKKRVEDEAEKMKDDKMIEVKKRAHSSNNKKLNNLNN